MPQTLAHSALQRAVDGRRQSDPLAIYHPHPKQQLFIDAVLKDPGEYWLCTANRFGKSDAVAYIGATLVRQGVPDPRPAIGPSAIIYDRAVSLWIIGPDWHTMQHSILPKLFDNGMVPPGQPHAPFIPAREMNQSWGNQGWHERFQVAKLDNGSLIQAKSNEQDQTKFAAAGVDAIAFDEEPRLAIYEESCIRVEAGSRLRIFGGVTLLPPEGQIGGVSWLLPKIVQPFLDGTSQVKVFGGSIYDNPHIAPEEIVRLESKYPPHTPMGKIRLGGEWLADIGGARKYHAFQRSIHVREQSAPDPHLPLCWCWDFNVTPFITLVGQRLGSRFHVYHEFVLENGSIPAMVDLFRAAYPRHGHEIWLYGDQTGQNRTSQTNQSSYTMILNTMRTYPTPCRLKIPTSNPSVIDRVNAMNNALADFDGRSCVDIDPQAQELLADFDQVIDDGRGGIRKVSNPRDPYYWRTHASDALGYWVVYEAPMKRAPIGGQRALPPMQRPRYAPRGQR